ncbi:Phenoloxidase subunit 1 [Blattella germanica]|nr:Phenoloxidase subunit 1 [Blattella germanica]
MARAPQSKDLLLMFDRPQEPIFMPKGDDGNVAFDVPSDLLENRIQVDMGIVDRLGASQADEHITVRSIALPDLSIPQSIARDQNFSLFIPLHRRAATRLIEIFLGMRNVDDLVSMCAACRERVNPYLFNYALSVALLHRPDTRNLPVPPLFENFPDKFVDGAIFSKARQESEIFTAGSRQPLEIPMDYTASDLDIEHRLAYFREDLGINLHHWHWHLVYPFNGPRNIVDKNRRGELFYYMHQQIIARYNLERFCNKLARVTRLLNWRDPIPEGYFPKLDSLVASRVWPPRHANALLSDVNREVDQLKVDIQDCERWRDRMYEAIHLGSIILETFSTIGDPATAMRDPIFYRWHAFVDDVFQEHKATLPPYEVNRVENGTNSDKIGTVRIFLGPKFDERGVNMLFRDQRLLFIELDKFTVTLKPKTNNIERNANDSSVTIPFERTFRDLQTSRPSGGTSLEQFNFCGCGWPHHMLIPKGTPEGFPCELFVMVSNFDDDKINQSIEGQCADAASFCGIRDKLYPDKRNMGYPFDRMPRNGVNTLQDFLTPNMRVQDVKIRFTGQTFDVQGAEITNSLT